MIDACRALQCLNPAVVTVNRHSSMSANLVSTINSGSGESLYIQAQLDLQRNKAAKPKLWLINEYKNEIEGEYVTADGFAHISIQNFKKLNSSRMKAGNKFGL